MIDFKESINSNSPLSSEMASEYRIRSSLYVDISLSIITLLTVFIIASLARKYGQFSLVEWISLGVFLSLMVTQSVNVVLFCFCSVVFLSSSFLMADFSLLSISRSFLYTVFSWVCMYNILVYMMHSLWDNLNAFQFLDKDDLVIKNDKASEYIKLLDRDMLRGEYEELRNKGWLG